MRSVESEIGGVLAERLAGDADAPPRRPLQRVEDFAVSHMRSLTLGAAGAVATLALALSFSGPSSQNLQADPVIVGSIIESPRVSHRVAWKEVPKPVELIALQAPQFQRLAPTYVARQSDSGDREDALVFEPGAAELPEARIALRRPAGTARLPSLFIDMTRQQAERGVAVTRAGAPGRLTTKFGEIDVADMTFQDHQGRSQSCLAFRSDGPIGLSGWYCAAQGAAVERPELGCFIDRLALIKAGEDKELRRYFAEAEQRRTPCPTTRLSTGRKPTWLDSDGKAPQMRGEITGSIGKR
jgi:hypothetical protein